MGIRALDIFSERIFVAGITKNNNAKTVAAETTHWGFTLCQSLLFHFVVQEGVTHSQRGQATRLKFFRSRVRKPGFRARSVGLQSR